MTSADKASGTGGEFGRSRRAAGGARARSKRGDVARTSWGRSFIEAVERMAEPGRLRRGRSYVRSGQVVSFQLEAGMVSAEIQGSQPRPFTAVCTVPTLEDETVDLLVDAIRSAPGMLAQVVSGSLPPALAPHLLPETASELFFGCTCPDQDQPCTHVAALCYLVAERLDEQPRDLLTLRGLTLDGLIGGVESVEPTESTERTDPYGDEATLPELPNPEFRPAAEDLDPTMLRRALRMLAEDEHTAAAGQRALIAVYRGFPEH